MPRKWLKRFCAGTSILALRQQYGGPAHYPIIIITAYALSLSLSRARRELRPAIVIIYPPRAPGHRRTASLSRLSPLIPGTKASRLSRNLATCVSDVISHRTFYRQTRSRSDAIDSPRYSCRLQFHAIRLVPIRESGDFLSRLIQFEI